MPASSIPRVAPISDPVLPSQCLHVTEIIFQLVSPMFVWPPLNDSCGHPLALTQTIHFATSFAVFAGVGALSALPLPGVSPACYVTPHM